MLIAVGRTGLGLSTETQQLASDGQRRKEEEHHAFQLVMLGWHRALAPGRSSRFCSVVQMQELAY